MLKACANPSCSQTTTDYYCPACRQERQGTPQKNGGRGSRGWAREARALYHRVRHHGSAECAHCGNFFAAKDIRIDHIIPIVDGGVDHPHNLQTLCVNCHITKTSREAHTRAKQHRQKQQAWGTPRQGTRHVSTPQTRLSPPHLRVWGIG